MAVLEDPQNEGDDMKVIRSERGFEYIDRLEYCNEPEKHTRLIGASSAIDFDVEGGYENPGTSYLWIGDHHLNREEVRELIDHMNNWLLNGSLGEVDGEE